METDFPFPLKLREKQPNNVIQIVIISLISNRY